jgi:hypothetical protein
MDAKLVQSATMSMKMNAKILHTNTDLVFAMVATFAVILQSHFTCMFTRLKQNQAERAFKSSFNFPPLLELTSSPSTDRETQAKPSSERP